jgi:NAD+ kinase
MGRAIRNVVVILNAGKAPVASARREMEHVFQERGVRALWHITRKADRTDRLPEIPIRRGACDLILVGGGDGTILQAARQTRRSGVPLLGINLGSLGFLSAVRREEIATVLPRVLDGHYQVGERMALEFTVWRRGKKIRTGWALNDAVVARGSQSHMVRVGLEVGGAFVTEYHCDGLVIATPTGSTAYSLSAGGPIVAPTASMFVITPICAHALTNRSLVVEARDRIELSVPERGKGMVLQVDGLACMKLLPGDRVRLAGSEQNVRIAQVQGVDFYRIVRQKLKWSGANI